MTTQYFDTLRAIIREAKGLGHLAVDLLDVGDNTLDKIQAEHAKLEAANKVLREALKFYSDEENWEDGCLEYTADDDIEGLTKTIDEGDTARKALKAADEIEGG